MSNPNQEILHEANEANLWFEAVKVAGVWAKTASEEGSISSREGETSAKTGDIICRGPDGETWVQTAENFEAKYQPTEETDDNGFRKHLPIPKKSMVMAAKIDHPFEVSTGHGLLSGEANDYLIKPHADKDNEFPDSAWIVGENIFATTYKRI